MSETYSTDLYPIIAQMEKNHFWFHGRIELFFQLIRTYISNRRGKTFLEIGCGTGVLLPLFQQLGFRVTGIDINREALYYAKRRSRATLVASPLGSYHPHRQYDCIGIFDILEHQKNDLLFLRQCHTLLMPHGFCFISVPAHQWLWNQIDTVSGHIRRYEERDLVKKLQKAGFIVRFSNHWNVFLLGFYMLWRLQFLFQKDKSQITSYFVVPARPINVFFRWILRLETALFFHIPFPFGSSLIVVAQKL